MNAEHAKLPDQKKRAVKTRPFGREAGILLQYVAFYHPEPAV